MKTLKRLTIVTITALTLLSCGNEINNQPENAEGFGVIENEVKSKFGEEAYYTDLKIIHIASIGNVISATVTEAPESMKMGEWNLNNGTWEQKSEVTLEVPEGSKASDFMFQLDEKINLSKLGELVEKSKEKLSIEKNIENPTLAMAYVKFPKNGDRAKTEYVVSLKPENGGTSFSFFYTPDGEFISMN